MNTRSNSLASTISKNIKKYRLMNNMTQEQMAARLYLDTQYYAQLERGERNFTVEKIVLACEVFQVGIEKIIPIHLDEKQTDDALISSIHEKVDTLSRNQLLLLQRFISECIPFAD